MTLKVTIEQVENGFQVTEEENFYSELSGKQVSEVRTFVFQEKEDLSYDTRKQKNLSEVETVKDALNQVVDCLGMGGGRYDYKRLYITHIPGDNFQGPIPDDYREDLTDLRDRIDGALSGVKEDLLDD